MDFKELLIKQNRWEAGLTLHMVHQLTDDLSEDELNWQAGSGHHSIWHNIWHMYLSNDYYSADAFETAGRVGRAQLAGSDRPCTDGESVRLSG